MANKRWLPLSGLPATSGFGCTLAWHWFPAALARCSLAVRIFHERGQYTAVCTRSVSLISCTSLHNWDSTKKQGPGTWVLSIYKYWLSKPWPQSSRSNDCLPPFQVVKFVRFECQSSQQLVRSFFAGFIWSLFQCQWPNLLSSTPKGLKRGLGALKWTHATSW